MMQRVIIPAVCILLFLLLFTSAALAEDAVNSWDEMKSLLARTREQNKAEVTFTISGDMMRDLESDPMLVYYHAARAGFQSVKYTRWSNGKIEMSEMTPFSYPYRIVESEEEFVSAVREMCESRADTFALLAEHSLYARLKADSSRRILFLKGGLYHFDRGYVNDGYCSMVYGSCSYADGEVLYLNGLKQASDVMANIGFRGYDAFAIVLDPETYQLLKANDGKKRLALNASGSIRGGSTCYDELNTIVYYKDGESIYYPGLLIIRAVQAGTEDNLPPRLEETLAAARNMVSGITGTPEEMAVSIHDLLCRHVQYEIDDNSEEDDSCIGAILNGRANCDGYADAFYLLCRLKGIETRMIIGELIDNPNPGSDPTHMWNLILLDGLWRGVDVTWDDPDRGDEIQYHQFNMGLDRMKEKFIFEADCLPENMLDRTDLAGLPVPEYPLSDWRDLPGYIRQAVSAGKTQMILRMSEALYRDFRQDSTPVWDCLKQAGVAGSAGHIDRDCLLVLSNLAWSGR